MRSPRNIKFLCSSLHKLHQVETTNAILANSWRVSHRTQLPPMCSDIRCYSNRRDDNARTMSQKFQKLRLILNDMFEFKMLGALHFQDWSAISLLAFFGIALLVILGMEISGLPPSYDIDTTGFQEKNQKRLDAEKSK